MSFGDGRDDAVVRAFTARDRAPVREICFRTGFMGDPIEWQWRDSTSFSDMFTRYYTDVEPESALVVEANGEVRGYLLGCVDSRRASNPVIIAGGHAVRRVIGLRPGTAAVIWRAIWDSASDMALRRLRLPDLDFSDARWPAHFHVDLLPEARGMGLGRRLVEDWLNLLVIRGVGGCHLQTFAENERALSFFRSVGFRPIGPAALAPGFRARDGSRLHLQVMVRNPVEPDGG
jgi:ribosomal protein S18 acetylase RimI-like enzyme